LPSPVFGDPHQKCLIVSGFCVYINTVFEQKRKDFGVGILPSGTHKKFCAEVDLGDNERAKPTSQIRIGDRICYGSTTACIWVRNRNKKNESQSEEVLVTPRSGKRGDKYVSKDPDIQGKKGVREVFHDNESEVRASP
jgi:hypothetical protein